jgi:hypothetical protein
MAVILEGVNDKALIVASGLFLVSAGCLAYGLWLERRERRRYHSYEPLKPKEEDHED